MACSVVNAGKSSCCLLTRYNGKNGTQQDKLSSRLCLVSSKLGGARQANLTAQLVLGRPNLAAECKENRQKGFGPRFLRNTRPRRQLSEIASAASEEASPFRKENTFNLDEHQKTGGNPYGYAWWKLVLAVIATAAFFYYYNTLETQMHTLQAADLPKITVPDKWPWPKVRTALDLEGTFRVLGAAGRKVYKHYLLVDFFFPLAYTVLYSQMLGFLVVWSQFWAKLAQRLYPKWAASLAYTIFPFDLLENAAIFYVLMHQGSASAHKLAAVSGYFTWIKFCLVIVNVSFMYWGLTVGVFDFVFKLLRHRYDGLSAIIYSLAQR